MDRRLQKEIALLHFEAAEKIELKVLHFTLAESVSKPFEATVNFLSFDPRLEFDKIVGRGAAITVYTSFIGERVWAGICSELELVNSEEHTGSMLGQAGDGAYKGMSRYRMKIRPALWRLSLRTNCRVFQHMSIPDIVKAILKEWDVEIDEKKTKLVDKHPKLEIRVQYHETDLDFVSRLLEEAGITYWLAPAEKIPHDKTPGRELTKVVLEDRPYEKQATYPGAHGALQYLGDDPNPGEFDQRPQMWGLSAARRPQALKQTVRDRDFRASMDKNPTADSDLKVPQGEEKYETFHYVPGAFWTERADHPADEYETPVADDKQKNRVDVDMMKELPEKLRDAVFTERTRIRFSSNTLDLGPGCIFHIGEEPKSAEEAVLVASNKHPHSEFSPKRKLMVTSRVLTGTAGGATYRCDCTAVLAGPATGEGGWPNYRPQRTTPKPQIMGVQSAVVVGPAGKEIFADEFGRVRVQFAWDREHDYDDDSSCWIRVSQPWAGGSFGAIAIPRIGHEVLVAFFEGDPDQPVIVGRVYNQTTSTPYFPVTKNNNWTRTAIRTDSTPHDRSRAGYNELMFEDARGRELIHIQAQQNLSIVVNASESHDVGGHYQVVVGQGGESSSFKMSPTMIEMRAPGCNLVVGQSGAHGSGIHIEAEDTVHFHSGGNVLMNSAKNIDVDCELMTIDTGKVLDMNSGAAKAPAVSVPDTSRARGGKRQGAPFLPDMKEKDPPAVGPFDDVKVGPDPEEAEQTAADGTAPGELLEEKGSGKPADKKKAGQMTTTAGAQKRIRELYGKYMSKDMLGKDLTSKVQVLPNADFQRKYLSLGGDPSDARIVAGFVNNADGATYLNADKSGNVVAYHEMLHAHTPDAFKGLPQAVELKEGYTQYLSEKELKAEGLTDPNHGYPFTTPDVKSIVDKVGEEPFNKAYFQGDSAALKAAVEKAYGKPFAEVVAPLNGDLDKDAEYWKTH